MKTFARYAVFPLLALCTACATGTQGELLAGRPGSSAWFQTAAPETVAAHFSARCTAYGYRPGEEMADCIRREVETARAKNAAVEAARASRPQMIVYCSPRWHSRRYWRHRPAWVRRHNRHLWNDGYWESCL